jgi:GcrA cell cycle regulator
MSTWTPEAVARLRGFHSEGFSFSEIASLLSRSRNSCIGKAHRLGMTQAKEVSVENHRKSLSSRASSSAPIRRRRLILKSDLIDDNAIPVEQRKTLMDLEPGDCRWPVGHPGEPDFFFCAAPAMHGHSYCPNHSARAWTKAPLSDRRTDKSFAAAPLDFRRRAA